MGDLTDLPWTFAFCDYNIVFFGIYAGTTAVPAVVPKTTYRRHMSIGALSSSCWIFSSANQIYTPARYTCTTKQLTSVRRFPGVEQPATLAFNVFTRLSESHSRDVTLIGLIFSTDGSYWMRPV